MINHLRVFTNEFLHKILLILREIHEAVFLSICIVYSLLYFHLPIIKTFLSSHLIHFKITHFSGTFIFDGLIHYHDPRLASFIIINSSSNIKIICTWRWLNLPCIIAEAHSVMIVSTKDTCRVKHPVKQWLNYWVQFQLTDLNPVFFLKSRYLTSMLGCFCFQLLLLEYC